MIVFLTFTSIVLTVLAAYNTWMVLSLKRSLVKIIGPKIDELEAKHTDLIKKLKKIL